eukprot:scaffold31067_cov138-Isochrysis_galbana.AAC.1
MFPAFVLNVAPAIASSLAGAAPAFVSGRLPDATPTFPAESASPPCPASALRRPVDVNQWRRYAAGECGEHGPAAPEMFMIPVTPDESQHSSGLGLVVIAHSRTRTRRQVRVIALPRTRTCSHTYIAFARTQKCDSYSSHPRSS